MENEHGSASEAVQPRFSGRWALALTTCSLMFLQGGGQSGSVYAYQGAGVIVEDPRPVGKAMAMLSRQLGWNISYEDPAYVNAEDLAKAPVNGSRAILRRGRVWLPVDAILAATQRDPVALLESVLATEETSRGRVKRFKVLRTGSMFHVVRRHEFLESLQVRVAPGADSTAAGIGNIREVFPPSIRRRTAR